MTDPIEQDASWYVVHTKPRQEGRAYENLANQGFECFLPMLDVQKKRQGKLQCVREPMFSRYLFIRLNNTTHNWSPIRSTLGVHALVRFGQSLAKVPLELIHLLRKAPAQNLVHLFTPGDPVGFTQGPLKGLEGVYDAHDGESRAFVLVELLGQQHRLRVALEALETMA